MYVAVKGGEKAIEAAHQLQEQLRRGDDSVPALGTQQIEQQLGLAVDRVMTEGGIYDPELAALAIKQASGDLVEAIFLLRAYRTTLPRLAVSEPLDTADMRLERRISAVYKDLPGGQVLGPTYDYTHRLLDFALLAEGEIPRCAPCRRTLARELRARVQSAGQQQLAQAEQDDGSTPMTSPAIRRFTLATLRTPATTGARRRRFLAGAGLFHPAGLRPQPPVRR